MPTEIAATREEELPELSRLLARRFGAAEDAEPFAADVLRWKYFERAVAPGVPRSFVARDRGRIVGHIGADLTSFLVVGGQGGRQEFSTLMMMDWVGSPEHPGVGMTLVRRVSPLVEIQFGLGGTAAARRVGRPGYYERLPDVPVFRRVLRPSYLRRGRSARGVLAAGRDLGHAILTRPSRPAMAVELRRVEAFGAEAAAIVDRLPGPLVLTDRRPPRLNRALAYPRPGLVGALVLLGDEPIGLALWNVVRRGALRLGKLVECLLDRRDAATHHAAVAAIVAALAEQGAEVVEACGSTPWLASALQKAGFRRAFDLEFRLRDRRGAIPRTGPFHMNDIEVDYAYL